MNRDNIKQMVVISAALGLAACEFEREAKNPADLVNCLNTNSGMEILFHVGDPETKVFQGLGGINVTVRDRNTDRVVHLSGSNWACKKIGEISG